MIQQQSDSSKCRFREMEPWSLSTYRLSIIKGVHIEDMTSVCIVQSPHDVLIKMVTGMHGGDTLKHYWKKKKKGTYSWTGRVFWLLWSILGKVKKGYLLIELGGEIQGLTKQSTYGWSNNRVGL